MTRVILVRHGQTEWNRVERFRGRADLALNEIGIRQARATAQALAGQPAARLYSSPLRRALMTSQILAEALGLSVTPLYDLIDIDYGEWQGLSLEEAEARDPALYAQWLEEPHLVRFPGGESLGEVRLRVVSALEGLWEKHKEETLLLVSHKVVCKLLLCSVLGLEDSQFWQIEQEVCAINVLEKGRLGPVVARLNDTCHLASIDLGPGGPGEDR